MLDETSEMFGELCAAPHRLSRIAFNEELFANHVKPNPLDTILDAKRLV